LNGRQAKRKRNQLRTLQGWLYSLQNDFITFPVHWRYLEIIIMLLLLSSC